MPGLRLNHVSERGHLFVDVNVRVPEHQMNYKETYRIIPQNSSPCNRRRDNMPQFKRTEDTTSPFCSYGQALQRLSFLDDIDMVIMGPTTVVIGAARNSQKMI